MKRNERIGWKNLSILDADKMIRKVELSNGPRSPPQTHHSCTGSPLDLTPRGVGKRTCLHYKGPKKTWLGLWSRTSPDKESWCDRWGWNWNQWSSWLTWRSDSAIPCFHQNCGKVPCTRPPAIDFITNNYFCRESPCTMVAPDFLGTSSVNSLRIGKGHTSSKEPYGNFKEKEWWLAQY